MLSVRGIGYCKSRSNWKMAKYNREIRLYFFDCYIIWLRVLNYFLGLGIFFLFFLYSIKCYIGRILVCSTSSCDWNWFIIFLMVLGVLVWTLLFVRSTVWVDLDIILFYVIDFSTFASLDQDRTSYNRYG